MKKVSLAALAFITLAQPVYAHFGMVIPDEPIINQEHRQSTVNLSFSHPFEGVGMNLPQPKEVMVSRDGKSESLQDQLKSASIMGHQGWQFTYKFKRPGVYTFTMEPQPYWEPAEDLSIIHYTKTIVPAYGADSGWDQPVGLPAEIVPLTRPFGNYAGNSFTGKVLINGEPSANAEVEVEYYNSDGKAVAPSDYHITQVVKTDANGVFSFTCPRAGWWGFAALSEADYTLKNPEGKDKPVEIGAVFWTYMSAMNTVK